MKLKDYLKVHKISKVSFAKKIDINRMTLTKYLQRPEFSTMVFRLAIEYLTAGEVKRDEWTRESTTRD